MGPLKKICQLGTKLALLTAFSTFATILPSLFELFTLPSLGADWRLRAARIRSAKHRLRSQVLQDLPRRYRRSPTFQNLLEQAEHSRDHECLLSPRTTRKVIATHHTSSAQRVQIFLESDAVSPAARAATRHEVTCWANLGAAALFVPRLTPPRLPISERFHILCDVMRAERSRS